MSVKSTHSETTHPDHEVDEHTGRFDTGEELEPDEPEPAPGLFRRDEHASDETVEYDVEGALERDHQAGEENEDVLEETPEFLQDAPEHDRLWFDQRPPRDFDFDG